MQWKGCEEKVSSIEPWEKKGKDSNVETIMTHVSPRNLFNSRTDKLPRFLVSILVERKMREEGKWKKEEEEESNEVIEVVRRLERNRGGEGNYVEKLLQQISCRAFTLTLPARCIPEIWISLSSFSSPPPFFFFSSGGGKVEKCLSRSFARVTFLAREHEFDGFFFLSFSFPRERKGWDVPRRRRNYFPRILSRYLANANSAERWCGEGIIRDRRFFRI